MPCNERANNIYYYRSKHDFFQRLADELAPVPFVHLPHAIA